MLSKLSKYMNKLLLGAIAVLAATSLWFYVQTNSLQKDVLNFEHQISSLQIERDILKGERDNLRKLQEVNDRITKQKEEISKTLQGAMTETLADLNKTKKTEKQGNKNVTKNAVDIPLDNDISRLLSALCYKVRGEECPNP